MQYQKVRMFSRGTSSDVQPFFSSLPPLALYVHIPWCLKKCPYCDFNSHAALGILPEQEYIAALCHDLERSLPLIWGRTIYSVFIGGGTPSLFSAAAIELLLSNIRALLPLSPDAEITLEANPGTVEVEKFRDFRAAGINRLSLGIQSFQDDALCALGRVHDAKQACFAVETARQIFTNINLDLMFALSGQTLSDCLFDLTTALQFQPEHLSYYQLTLEENTYFAKHPPPLPDHDEAFSFQTAIEHRTAQAGYEQYEVSCYARGPQAQHNLNYWRFGDYLGIGAGAHGKISFADRVIRQVKYRQPKLYMESVANNGGLAQEITVTAENLLFEFMLGSMRLKQGVPVSLFTQRTGLPLAMLTKKLKTAYDKKLLEPYHVQIQPSALGWRFLNDLQSLFLPET